MLAGCTQSHEIGTWTGNDFLQIFTSKQIIFVAFIHNGFDEEAKSNQKQEKKKKEKKKKTTPTSITVRIGVAGRVVRLLAEENEREEGGGV